MSYGGCLSADVGVYSTRSEVYDQLVDPIHDNSGLARTAIVAPGMTKGGWHALISSGLRDQQSHSSHRRLFTLAFALFRPGK